jgi:hypothetical protein
VVALSSEIKNKKFGVFNEKGFFSTCFFCGILEIFHLQKGLEGPNISSEQLGELPTNCNETHFTSTSNVCVIVSTTLILYTRKDVCVTSRTFVARKETAATKVGFVVSTASARNGSSIPRALVASYLDLYRI